MKRSIFFITALFGLFSCSNDSDKPSDFDTLLTSTEWTVPIDANDQKPLNGVWSFQADGTYIENFDKKENANKIVLKGQWKWISENELSIVYKSMLVNGKNNELSDDDGDAYILRITELTKKELKVIKRFNGDAEDSGFAKEVSYMAAEMK